MAAKWVPHGKMSETKKVQFQMLYSLKRSNPHQISFRNRYPHHNRSHTIDFRFFAFFASEKGSERKVVNSKNEELQKLYRTPQESPRSLRSRKRYGQLKLSGLGRRRFSRLGCRRSRMSIISFKRVPIAMQTSNQSSVTHYSRYQAVLLKSCTDLSVRHGEKAAEQNVINSKKEALQQLYPTPQESLRSVQPIKSYGRLNCTILATVISRPRRKKSKIPEGNILVLSVPTICHKNQIDICLPGRDIFSRKVHDFRSFFQILRQNGPARKIKDCSDNCILIPYNISEFHQNRPPLAKIGEGSLFFHCKKF